MNALNEYTQTLNLIEEDLCRVKINTEKSRIKIASTLFVLAINHAQGIKYCLKNRAFTSAFALMRALFDSLIRGMWIEKCATDKQIKIFINKDKIVSTDGNNLHFSDMVGQVEKDHEMPTFLSDVQANVWKLLNSLTHSGAIQINNNFDGKSIRSCYTEQHITEAIDFSTMLACISYSGICSLATNKNDIKNSAKIASLIHPDYESIIKAAATPAAN